MQRLQIMILCFLLLSMSHQSIWAFPTVYPTGTTIYEPGKTFEGYTIYTKGIDLENSQILLINMQGNIVHYWENSNLKLGFAEPLSNGNLLAFVGAEGLVELDWNGNIVWAYFADVRHRKLHHDFERLENGNTLVLCSKLRNVPEISPKPIMDDYIIEVNPGKETVWSWYTSEHFDEFEFSAGAKRLIATHGGDWSHTNSIQSLPDNSIGDPRFQKGNILVSQRHTNIIFIIDKDSGQIVWKIGPDDNLTIGQHNAQMMEEGRGAGNILVFDNGGIAGYPEQSRVYSRVVVIDPVSKEVVWIYTALKSGLPRGTFFSAFKSGVQRLPNGNTLIDEAMNGRFFEITRKGEIVWEYINPYFRRLGAKKINCVYRIWRVPLDWPTEGIARAGAKSEVVPPAKPVSPIPKEFRLLQNCPNPFNPDTWLPYELAQDASVTISIYNIKGQLVRQLDIGRQKAGIYLDKEKAAYWNAKDQTGKSVSSGLYFYTLKAGDFQATRRMVIVK